MKIYLAGKIGKHCWRHSIVDDLREALDGFYDRIDSFPVLPQSIFGHHDYVGPYFVSCDHGCFHGPQAHGLGLEDLLSGHGYDGPCMEEPFSRRTAIDLCFEAIERADVVFAWIDDLTCYGTLVEIGYAKAKGIAVWVSGIDTWIDAWFAWEMADKSQTANGQSPRDVLLDMLGLGKSFLRSMPYRDYLLTPHWKQKRQEALLAADHRCQLCNGNDRLEVHHRTYERRGDELPSDLTVLCKPCHNKFHGGLGASALVRTNRQPVSSTKAMRDRVRGSVRP